MWVHPVKRNYRFSRVLRSIAYVLFASAVSTSGAAAQALPTGWSATNVGTVSVPGASTYASGAFSITGSGHGPSTTADQFRFVYIPMSGDGRIVARVGTSVSGTGAMVGLVLRDTLSPGSRGVSFVATGSSQLELRRRLSTDWWATPETRATGVAPIWLRLERRGSTMVASRSTDGVNWQTFGSTTVSLGATVYAGLAVASGSSSRSLTATFASVTVSGTTAPPPPVPTGNQPPTISLTSPAAGSSFAAPATLAIGASAADPDGTIARVDFYNGFTLIGSDTTSPYAVTWSNVPTGSYPISAIARDNAGATTTSAARAVTVTTNLAPNVSLTAPTATGTFLAPATITLAATASDPDGTIARVDFYAGTALLGSDTASPYTLAWTGVAAGLHSLTAVARDNAGGTTVSSVVPVTVSAGTLPQFAVFSASSNHATGVDRYVVDFYPAGANPATANPVASRDVGKPAVVNGECRGDVGSVILGLVPGSYFATVTALSSSGQARSAPSPVFMR